MRDGEVHVTCTGHLKNMIRLLLSKYCNCLVGLKWAPPRKMPFATTKEYIWGQNKDYVGGGTC